ncbi:store-operated calcium entry-associated regulatory factor [Pholidichthys leucotaenia]
MKEFITAGLLLLLLGYSTCWDDGSVLLRDIQALTLYRNRYTTARRSTPVPQLKCVGGSAGCHSFAPDVVQCVNRGWDGVDVQWECKTDMDNAYRFGRVEVNCEGYSHPADAYILKGSCGLEYTLELTEEGHRRSHGGFQGFEGLGRFASSFFSGSSDNKHQHQSSSPSGGEGGGSLLIVVVLLLLAYCVYKLFISGGHGQGAWDGGPAGDPRDHHSSMGGPPPPGFKPDYTDPGYPGATPGSGPGYGFHSDYTQGHQYGGGQAAPGTGGGFWSGMGTGGLLGYLFGRQRNQPHHMNFSGYQDNRPTRAAPSSGTRTASGFGGTKRR